MAALDSDLVAWIKREYAEAFRDPETGGTIPLQQRAVAALRLGEPEQAAELERRGLLEKLGVVLEWRMWMDADNLVKGGMSPLEARSQAEAEWMYFGEGPEPPMPLEE